MEYFTMDGHFTRAHSHHFMFLNQFKYKDIINIPYYLHCSLIKSLQKHKSTASEAIRHEGLIILIYEFIIASNPSPSSILGKKSRSHMTPSSGSAKRKGEANLGKGSKRARSEEMDRIYSLDHDKIEEYKENNPKENKNVQSPSRETGEIEDSNYETTISREGKEDNSSRKHENKKYVKGEDDHTQHKAKEDIHMEKTEKN